MRRLWALSRPERHFLVLALVAATFSGCVFPVFSLILSTIISFFYLSDPDELQRKVRRRCFAGRVVVVVVLAVVVVVVWLILVSSSLGIIPLASAASPIQRHRRRRGRSTTVVRTQDPCWTACRFGSLNSIGELVTAGSLPSLRDCYKVEEKLSPEEPFPSLSYRCPVRLDFICAN